MSAGISQSSGSDRIALVVVGLLGLCAAFVGLAMATNRLVCGAWATPDHPLGVLDFFPTGDMGAFGRTPDGCAAEVWHLVVILAVIVAIIVAAAVAITIGISRYRQSDRYLIKELKYREGMAKPAEMRRLMGRKRILKKSKEVRPSLSKKDRKDPQNSGFHRGTARGVDLYVSMEESQLLLGPPRSGKGVGIIIGDIIDAPGPVITTSTRADNLAATMKMRQKPLDGHSENRPVAIFDPQGISGQATTFKWSPITGCQSPQVANQRASSLIASTGLHEDSTNAEWAAPATTIMECLLHAAALDGRSVDDLMLWGNSEAEAKEAANLLKYYESRGQAALGWGEALESIINGDPKMRGNQWFGVRNAVKGLAVPNVRAALKPLNEAEEFNIDEFLEKSGTLYVIGTKTGGSSAGPFLIAFLDAITERAREIAAQKPSNRLDPPLSLVLDEIANIAKAWPGLITLMADGGGVGINPHPVFQSMSQIKQNWGADAAGALWEAANVVTQLRGSKDTENLRSIQELAGTFQHTWDSKSRSESGTSTSEQVEKRNVIEIDELKRLPFGWGVILAPGARLIFAQLRLFFKRKDAKEIAAAKKEYYAAHNIEDDSNVNSPTRGQARGWADDPGNRAQPIDEILASRRHSSQAASPEEVKAELAAQSDARNTEAMSQVPGAEWDSKTGTIAYTGQQPQASTVVSAAEEATETGQEGSSKRRKPRNLVWGG